LTFAGAAGRIVPVTKFKRSAPQVLLACLVILVVASPIVRTIDIAGLSFAVEGIFCVVLLAAVYAEQKHFSWRRPAVWFVVVAFLLRFAATGAGPSSTPESYKALLVFSELYTAILIFYLTYVLVSKLTATDRVRADTVSGIAAAYILLAIGFGSLHIATFVVQEGDAFRGFQHNLESDLQEGKSSLDQWGPDLMYYSVVTQTTLGYGDITPKSDLARGIAMAQTIIGQLFLAIILARIVGMELAQRSAGDRE
jgi:hypothetical protein